MRRHFFGRGGIGITDTGSSAVPSTHCLTCCAVPMFFERSHAAGNSTESLRCSRARRSRQVSAPTAPMSAPVRPNGPTSRAIPTPGPAQLPKSSTRLASRCRRPMRLATRIGKPPLARATRTSMRPWCGPSTVARAASPVALGSFQRAQSRQFRHAKPNVWNGEIRLDLQRRAPTADAVRHQASLLRAATDSVERRRRE
jgi:hypothetical protein